MQNILLKSLGLPFLCFALAACSQTPAKVVMKGHEYYGQGKAPVQVASSAPSRVVAAAPTPKPASATQAVVVRDIAPVANERSYGFEPSPSTVAVREQAQMAQVQVKELEPITAAKKAPSPQVQPEPVMMLPEPQARVVAENKTASPNNVSSEQNVSGSGFIWPVKGKVISRFGPKAGGEYNDGINIAAREGEPIVAAADGEVVYSGNELRGYGNMVIVRHSGNIMTAYAHASRILVNKGDKVHQGTALALVGKSGGLDQAQVHFGIRKNKEPVDPMEYLGANQFASR